MGESENPCGEIVLGASQKCVLPPGIDPATLPWPCFIEHGSPIGDVVSLAVKVQTRANDEDMPVRWIFNDHELIAYPGNKPEDLLDQWNVKEERRSEQRSNARWQVQKDEDLKVYAALDAEVTLSLYEAGRRSGKTEAMRMHVLKARNPKNPKTLMEILAKVPEEDLA